MKLIHDEKNFRVSECCIFKTQPGPVMKIATLGPPAADRTHDLVNLVQCSVNWATKAVANSLAMSSIKVVMLVN